MKAQLKKGDMVSVDFSIAIFSAVCHRWTATRGTEYGIVLGPLLGVWWLVHFSDGRQIAVHTKQIIEVVK